MIYFFKNRIDKNGLVPYYELVEKPLVEKPLGLSVKADLR